ncbi:MAG: putative transposase [Sediminicola sp.]|jgi:putative transposase
MATCRLFGVNRQVYCRSKKSEGRSRQRATQVVAKVREACQLIPELGTRKLYERVYHELRELKVARYKLFSIMGANDMQIKKKRQYHVTTNSHHWFRKHKNLIEHLEVIRPEQVWVSHITYVGNRSNPMYLSLVTDAYSKKIMDFNVSSTLSAQGAVRALKMAVKKRKYPIEDLIHHSDRGLQYCCNDYQDTLGKYKISPSMTEKYDPYQNAVAERINGILKQEFIRGIFIKDSKLMDRLITQSIQIYN